MSATAKQKRWLKLVAERLPCIVSGESYSKQIHHCLGRTAKVKGVGNIGHWFILPLAWEYHDVASNSEYNVTHHKQAFTDRFGTEKDLFMDVVYKLGFLAKWDKSINTDDFPPQEVVDAILNYTR